MDGFRKAVKAAMNEMEDKNETTSDEPANGIVK